MTSTRRVAQRKTHHRGREVDLVAHVRKNQRTFILKPNDDYGGRGISLGETHYCTGVGCGPFGGARWAITVLEKIELRSEVFPIFGETRWALQPMYVDTNPFLFGGRAEGGIVRLSDSPVTSGGAEATMDAWVY